MFSNRVATSSASSDVSDGSDDVFDGSDPRQLAIDLLVTSARFTRLAARETPTGMPRALWRALALLDDLGPARVSDLAAADRVSQPTATTLVQNLVQRGWAQRCVDPLDGRAVRVTVTAAGQVALEEARDAAAEALVPRLGRLDAEGRRALAAGIDALCLVLEADPPRGLPAQRS